VFWYHRFRPNQTWKYSLQIQELKSKKGDINRVTVAYHGWDAVDDKAVYHPSQTGQHIGTIDGCLGEDIGMLNCTEPFSNQFPDIPCRAKLSFIRPNSDGVNLLSLIPVSRVFNDDNYSQVIL
jgi:hypothetical protein